MWYLISRKESGTPHILRRYDTLKGAMTGLRASNRNAGWTRVSRAWSDYTHMEWCAKTNGLPEYDYGPYVIMHNETYAQKYRPNELVEVKNLMTGEPTWIPRRDRGTCVDPSQERYWSM